MSVLPPEAFPALLDHCGQALLAIDPETQKIVHANAEAGLLLECEPDQLIGIPITQIETGLGDHFFWNGAQANAASGCPLTESTYRSALGYDRTVEKSICRQEIAGRTLLLIRAREITGSRIVEELSAHTASLLAATFEATADGLLVTNKQGCIQNFNHRFATLFDLSPEIGLNGNDAAVIEQLLSRLQEPDDWTHLASRVEQTPDREIHTVLTLRSERHIECIVRPQHLHAKIVGHVWCFSNITDRIRYEDALLSARNAATSANRAKSQFLAAMSHELKTPLNAILGFSDLIALDNYPDQADSVRLIRQAGSHLLELINQVLELARAEAGRIELNPMLQGVDEIIAEVIEIITPLANQQRIRIDYTHDSSPQVIADALRIRQVLLNLLSNAIKYNRPNGWVRIRHEETSEGRVKYLRITIEDGGIGISEANQLRIFEPFVRAASNSEEVEGTGLGLALTHRLVTLMEGRMGFSSTLGSGSQFWVELPAT